MLKRDDILIFERWLGFEHVCKLRGERRRGGMMSPDLEADEKNCLQTTGRRMSFWREKKLLGKESAGMGARHSGVSTLNNSSFLYEVGHIVIWWKGRVLQSSTGLKRMCWKIEEWESKGKMHRKIRKHHQDWRLGWRPPISSLPSLYTDVDWFSQSLFIWK